MRVNYDHAGRQLVTRVLVENNARLSRTSAGLSDTGTSSAKRPLRLSGDDLRRRTAENERRVQEFIFDSRHDSPPVDAAALRELLWRIADITNDALLPTGQQLRGWPSRPEPPGPAVDRTSPDNLLEALDQFAAQVQLRWPELAVDPIPLASWAEWELNGGSLHPFYDGCGRISRSFGALLLVRGSSLLPLYDNSQSYFEHGHQGPTAFAAYVTARVQACADWLSG